MRMNVLMNSLCEIFQLSFFFSPTFVVVRQMAYTNDYNYNQANFIIEFNKGTAQMICEPTQIVCFKEYT